MEENRRPYLILVRFTGSAFWHEADLNKLRVVLPANTCPVWVDGAVTFFATNSRYTSGELERVCKQALGKGRFEAVTVVQLGFHSSSSDGFLDPLHDWMDANVRQSPGQSARRERDNAEDMFKAKWGQPRRKDTEHRGVIDAIRKVFAPRRPGHDHA